MNRASARGGSIALALALATMALAEEPSPEESPRPRQIEEIVVTAQKKAETLREVPISLSVLNEAFLREQNVTDFFAVSRHVPNVSLRGGGVVGRDVNIRGFGSPLSNMAFEQPVGLVIDGVPYSTLPYWEGPLFDLDRVEVLRGPQGTFFGKNTTAGLFNVSTKGPTSEMAGAIDLQFGELGRRRVEGALAGPILADVLELRVAALSDEREGLRKNTTGSARPESLDRMLGQDRQAIRAKARFPDLAAVDLTIGYERAEFDIDGTGWELAFVADERQIPIFREYDPRTDLVPGNYVGSVDHPERYTRTIDTVVANAAVPIGDWSLSAVAGHSVLRTRNPTDADLASVPMFWSRQIDEHNPQTTFELRTDSPALPGLFGLARAMGFDLGWSEVTAGVFYQHRTLDTVRTIAADVALVGRFTALKSAPAPGGTPFGSIGLPSGAAAEFAAIEETTGFFDQTMDSFAAFGQVSWSFAARWTLQSGMRLTEERKAAHWQRIFNEGTGLFFPAALNMEAFTADRDRSELGFTPKIALKYDWTDEIGLYASWARGFKSGGFNELASNPNALEYETENATSWETGAKARLFGGVATVNLGLFRQDVSDLQVFTVQPGDLQFLVDNAGEARSQGIEGDLNWLPADWLTLSATVGLIDAEYLEFPFADCPDDLPNTDGDDDARCDVSGRPLPFTPRWRATFGPGARVPLTSIPALGAATGGWLGGVELVAGVFVEYRDDHFTSRTLDARTRQPSFVRLDGRIGLADEARGWSARIIVENLSDETVVLNSFFNTLMNGTRSQIVDSPRLVLAQIQWSF